MRELHLGQGVHQQKTLNKIEFNGEDAYFVLSRYVENNGRGCVLEMVSKLSNGRWLDMGGRRAAGPQRGL